MNKNTASSNSLLSSPSTTVPAKTSNLFSKDNVMFIVGLFLIFLIVAVIVLFIVKLVLDDKNKKSNLRTKEENQNNINIEKFDGIDVCGMGCGDGIV